MPASPGSDTDPTDLAFPGINAPDASPFELAFMLWLYRLSVQTTPDDGLLDAELSCCFGSELAFAATAASKDMCRALADLTPRLSTRSQAPATTTERLLLRAYSLIRHDRADASTAVIAHLFGTDSLNGARFRRQATLFAKLFQHRATLARHPHLVRFRSHIAQHLPAMALPPALGATLIFAMRIWVAARQAEHDPQKAILSATDDCLTGVWVDALNSVFGNLCAGPRRPVAVNCICSDIVSDDERGFLAGLAAMRVGNAGPLLALLEDWQMPTAARQSVAPAMTLAALGTRRPGQEADHGKGQSDAHRLH